MTKRQGSIPYIQLVCGNCQQWRKVVRPNMDSKCELLEEERKALSLTCFHIFKNFTDRGYRGKPIPFIDHDKVNRGVLEALRWDVGYLQRRKEEKGVDWSDEDEEELQKLNDYVEELEVKYGNTE